jgi:hypothetical protein
MGGIVAWKLRGVVVVCGQIQEQNIQGEVARYTETWWV